MQLYNIPQVTRASRRIRGLAPVTVPHGQFLRTKCLIPASGRPLARITAQFLSLCHGSAESRGQSPVPVPGLSAQFGDSHG
jgi:hypothetical protein